MAVARPGRRRGARAPGGRVGGRAADGRNLVERGEGAHAFIQRFSGSNRHVLDYLTDEVLDRQRAATRRFLLATSILTRLSPSLCDAVLERSDSERVLQLLDAGEPLPPPARRRALLARYRHLFATLLQHQLACVQRGGDCGAASQRVGVVREQSPGPSRRSSTRWPRGTSSTRCRSSRRMARRGHSAATRSSPSSGCAAVWNAPSATSRCERSTSGSRYRSSSTTPSGTFLKLDDAGGGCGTGRCRVRESARGTGRRKRF